MVAVGMLLIWGGYGTGLWGWCLIRDYDLTFGQLLSPAHPYSGPWPPAKIGSDVIWPGGRTAPAAAATASTASTAPAQQAQQPGIIEKIIKYLGTPKLP
jgi:hypothetical protein